MCTSSTLIAGLLCGHGCTMSAVNFDEMCIYIVVIKREHAKHISDLYVM